MTKDEMKNRISMALKNSTLQQGFEIICKNLAELEKENAELKKQNIKDCENFNKKMKEIKEQWNKEHYQLTKAKEIMNVTIEGIKYWGIVGGTERPFEKQAEKLFNLFLDKAEQFLKEVEK